MMLNLSGKDETQHRQAAQALLHHRQLQGKAGHARMHLKTRDAWKRANGAPSTHPIQCPQFKLGLDP